MIPTLALTLMPLAACNADSPLTVEVGDLAAATAVVGPDEVVDLAVVDSAATALTVAWTQVDDGTGEPASYRVKYGEPPIDWELASTGCEGTVRGDAIGAPISCVVDGLEPGSPYEIRLMSHRSQGGRWKGAALSNVAEGRTRAARPEGVQDLVVTGATSTALTVRWTDVDDGTGDPAHYRVKYDTPPLDWGEASTACTQVGSAVGSELSCEITGLTPESSFDVQLMSYRLVDGVWQDAVYSNVVTGRTLAAEEVRSDPSIWIGAAEIAALPTTGDAWQNLLSGAQQDCGPVDLADQEADTNVCVMAKALVYARTGEATYAVDVLGAIREIVTASTYDGRALALGRELAAYVIAADVVGLASLDPGLDLAFRGTLQTLLTTYTRDGPESLVVCHEVRPNNWGTHCGASRAAVAAYLGDTVELDRVAQVFNGWLGDRSSYAGFSFGDLSWQCNPDRPVGINPAGCTRDGHDVGGVLPDDQRRAGPFTWPAPRENYVWEALQGALVQAVILDRAGYPAFDWGDKALLRAVTWLHDVADYPAEGDDTWQTHVINHAYGSSFPVVVPSRAGKNVGWTDWTHGG